MNNNIVNKLSIDFINNLLNKLLKEVTNNFDIEKVDNYKENLKCKNNPLLNDSMISKINTIEQLIILQENMLGNNITPKNKI